MSYFRFDVPEQWNNYRNIDEKIDWEDHIDGEEQEEEDGGDDKDKSANNTKD